MRFAAALLALIAGCSPASDPATSRLQPGQQAVIYGGGKPVYITIGKGLPEIAEGTKVRIGSDDSNEHEREVAVIVLEGEHKEQGGKVFRNDLRPLPD